MRKNICILIMPTDQCNMNCLYCYHTPHYDSVHRKVMDIRTLDNIFKKTIPLFEHVDFLWHGGEPLLAGLDFYKSAVKLQKKYAGNSCTITNKIQTNCTLAQGEMLEYLVNERFDFGTSLDGVTNDYSRGNTKEILQGIENLRTFNKKCNCILVISAMNCDLMVENYNYFKEKNISFKFNHYIDTTHNDISKKLSVSLEKYLNSQRKFFDYWLFDTECNIRVTTFFVYLEYILFRRRLLGKYNSCLGKWLGVRYNGDIVQCNRYNNSYYGNINELSQITEAFESEGFKEVLQKAIIRRDKCRVSCDVYDFCQGGCIVEAFHEAGIECIHNFSCIETREMYKYILNKINIILADYDKYKSVINPTVKSCIEQYFTKKM